MFVGGDIIEIKYTHPQLGSGTLYCKANEDGTMDRGGFRTNDDVNSVTGAGEMIVQLNRALASFESPPIAWDMTDKDELEKLNKLAGHPVNADWTITSVNGAIYGGNGRPVGEVTGNTNTAQITLKLAFEGELQKIS